MKGWETTTVAEGRSMKVAVASQDGVSISDHFGRSNCFIVFDVSEGQILGSEVRRDSFTPQPEDACERTPHAEAVGYDYRDMIAALAGCQVVLCRGMGWHAASELVRCGINPMVIQDELAPRAAVLKYIAGALTPAAGFCRVASRPNAADD